MNYEQKNKMKRKLLDYIVTSSKFGNLNCKLNIKSGNTYEHELGKFNLAYYLASQGYDVYTEAILKNSKGIPDIVAIKDGQGMIIEVLHSEKEKVKKLDHNPKIDKYPEDFFFIEINSEDVLKQVTSI